MTYTRKHHTATQCSHWDDGVAAVAAGPPVAALPRAMYA